jgi:hypothetical protein
MMLALLVVTLLTSGGPHYAKPERIGDGFLRVAQGRRIVAVSHSGRLNKRLAPGHYRVLGSAPHILGGATCDEKLITIRRGHTTRLKLYCNIK